MQPGALHLKGLWSRLMDRTGGGWFLITRYTKTKSIISYACKGTTSKNTSDLCSYLFNTF